MKKKLCMMLLAVVLCFSGITGTALAAGLDHFQPVKSYAEGQFIDVSASAWYAPNVKEAYELDLINGKSSTHFDPDGNLTLGEAVKLAACLHSIYYQGSVEIDLSGADVWYQPYVDYAKEQGILPAGFDYYNRAATRLEFASVLAKALPEEALPAINVVEDNAIPDFPLAGNNADGVYLLYRAGVLIGNNSSGEFTPNNTIARSEAAAIVTRMADPDLRRSITLTNQQGSGGILTAEQIADQCSPAVFYLVVYDENGNAFASGSGFFLSADGLAVTNYHVIENAYSARIMTTDGSVYQVEGVYDYDTGRDVALLKIKGNGFPYLSVGQATVSQGMTIYTIGSPRQFDNTISQGLVSNANRVIDGYSYIQISAPISHGSSGGALLNTSGQVIGITSAGREDAQNLNFAIPISAVDSLSRTTVTSLADISGSHPEVSRDRITINVGDRASLQVSCTNPNSSGVMYQLSAGGEQYISCQWGDWNSSYTQVPLYLTGLAAGTVEVEIYEIDENDQPLGGGTTVTVTVQGGEISYYDGYYPALDFGAFTGIPEAATSSTDVLTGYCYDYSLLSKAEWETAVSNYQAALEARGFSLLGTVTDENNDPVTVLNHASYEITVLIGTAEIGGGKYLLIALSDMY